MLAMKLPGNWIDARLSRIRRQYVLFQEKKASMPEFPAGRGADFPDRVGLGLLLNSECHFAGEILNSFSAASFICRCEKSERHILYKP
jgi:hypothetical protein